MTAKEDLFNQLYAQIKALQTENADLKKDLRFYKNLAEYKKFI